MKFYNIFNLQNNYKNIPFKEKVKKLIISYLLTLMFIGMSVILLNIVDAFVTKILHYDSILAEFKKSREHINKYIWIKIVFLTPLIEEILFRLALKKSKWNLAIFAAFLTFAALYESFYKINLQNVNFYYSLGGAFFMGCIFYFKSEYLSKVTVENYRYIIASSIILFGLMHILNIKPICSLILFYPFYVIPQMIMGYFISNMRLKFNFWWGLALHCLINLISVIFYNIK
jgi:hypothetical protein